MTFRNSLVTKKRTKVPKYIVITSNKSELFPLSLGHFTFIFLAKWPTPDIEDFGSDYDINWFVGESLRSSTSELTRNLLYSKN